MPSNFTIGSDSLDATFTISAGTSPLLQAYSTTGTILNWSNNKLVLQPGQNVIGFFVKSTPPGDNANEWVDFVWDTIYSGGQLAIDPATMSGQTGTSYTWHAVTGSLPSNVRYEWDFGDHTAKVIVTNDNSVSHTFSTDGSYTISLALYDNSKNTLIGQATASASIGGLWALFHGENAFKMSLKTKLNYSDGTSEVVTTSFPMYTGVMDLSWKDTTFTGTLRYQDYRTGTEYDSEICNVSGVMLSDGLTIKSLTVAWRYSRVVKTTSGKQMYDAEDNKTMTVKNAVGMQVDYGQPPKILPSFLWDTNVDKLVPTFTEHWVETISDTASGTPKVTTRDLTSVSWNADITSDILDILFTKQ